MGKALQVREQRDQRLGCGREHTKPEELKTACGWSKGARGRGGTTLNPGHVNVVNLFSKDNGNPLQSGILRCLKKKITLMTVWRT